MENILLTGATGYLGGQLFEWWLSRGYNVSVLHREQSPLEKLEAIASRLGAKVGYFTLETLLSSKTPVDTVVHCATNYGRQSADKAQIALANLELPQKLLDWSANNGVTKFINTDTVLNPAENDYAFFKKEFREYLERHPAPLAKLNLELEHFYGPGDTDDKFLTRFVHELIKQVPEIPLTRGEQKRNFIYIQDVLNAYQLLLEKPFSPGFYNFHVGCEEAWPLRQVLSYVRDLVGNTSTELNFGARAYRSQETMASSTDFTELKALGWSSETSLEQGLAKIVDWEKAQAKEISS